MPTATTTKSMFGRETTVSTDISADAATVWTLITNIEEMPHWNSTIVSIEGDIAAGGKVALVSTLDEKRTFNLDIKEFVPNSKLVWGDRQGARTYTIIEREDGVTFTMSEKIGGLLFPLFSRFIPPFDEAFEQYAADLKKAAESPLHNKG